MEKSFLEWKVSVHFLRVRSHEKFIIFLDSKFETQNSILETLDSILQSFENRESSLESRALRRKWLLTNFWVVP